MLHGMLLLGETGHSEPGMFPAYPQSRCNNLPGPDLNRGKGRVIRPKGAKKKEGALRQWKSATLCPGWREAQDMHRHCFQQICCLMKILRSKPRFASVLSEDNTMK